MTNVKIKQAAPKATPNELSTEDQSALWARPKYFAKEYGIYFAYLVAGMVEHKDRCMNLSAAKNRYVGFSL